MNQTKKTLLDCLKEICSIDPEAYTKAEHEAIQSQKPIEHYLLEEGIVSAVNLALATAQYLNIQPISLSDFSIDPELLKLLDKEHWAEYKSVPICKVGSRLTIAMADPFDVVSLDAIASATSLELDRVVAVSSELDQIFETIAKDSGQSLDDLFKDITDDDELELSEEIADGDLDENEVGGAPVIRIVNSILIDAMRTGASDIHIEPMEKRLRLRNRVDGVLYETSSPPKNLQNAIISRLKIMSNLDIAERRVPQDGRFKVKALGKEVDIRMSVLPTVHGEKIVMRILDKTSLAPNLGALGLDKLSLDNFSYALSQPFGMLLVTGPTGSGKTTTLYSALQEINVIGTNIITTENPVEYQLEGINQVQINPVVGLTFAGALRSILRQDPDVVMVGEIRDGETASIAVEAALTGHLMLSTLHTNDAAGAIARLVDMGIEPFMLASSLLLTQAQRLFRRLCPVCKKEINIPLEILKKNRVDPEKLNQTQFYKPAGCPKCNGVGYKGRGGIMEILLIDDVIRRAVLETSEADQIKKIAIKNGMRTLREAGLSRIREGLTTIEEIMRVTSE